MIVRLMRSIFTKVFLWFVVTLLICLAGSTVTHTFRMRFFPGSSDFLSRTFSFETEGARLAFEGAGKEGLRSYFHELNAAYPGKHILVDERNRDVVTGVDLAEVLRHAVRPTRWTLPSQGRATLVWPSKDHKFQMLIESAGPPGGPFNPVPFYIWIAVAAALCCSFLTLQLVSPLKKLEQAVERFGRGDLSSRAESKRADEIGNLARAFNTMADRTETLLTAERRLLQDVSHELRSPLARLEFAVELSRTSSNRNQALERIKKEVGRLTTLVSELLQVTRAESDPASCVREDISLNILLRDIIDDSAVESEARNLDLHLTPCDSAFVKGDPELLRRAVENVVRNAIRYAPEQTPVEIALECLNSKVIISVRDYGPGVPEPSLENLFRPFYRVEADRNRNQGGGVGLGLSIAQRAISLHHGSIRAVNANPGLRVEIELPVAASKPVLAEV